MSLYVLPVLFTLAVWWFSTGAILYLDGLPRRTFRWSFLGATVALAWSLYTLAESSTDTSVAGAYLAFLCGVIVLGLAGNRLSDGIRHRSAGYRVPGGHRGWRRAGYALQTIIYHELALIGLAAAVIAVTWEGPNHVGTWTFLILWAMRQSAKLNLFLGARNLSEEFLPPHLRYLASYFTRKPMNLLFPFSVTISTVVAALVWQQAFSAAATPFEATGLTFAGTLLTLAILEHWFLMLPIPATALWNWGLHSHAAHENEAQRPAELHRALVATKE